MLKASSYRIAFGFIEEIVLQNYITLCWLHFRNYCSHRLVYVQVYAEKRIDFSFAAVRTQQKDREKEQDYHSDQQVQAAIAEVFSLRTHDVYFQVRIFVEMPDFSNML